MTPHTDPSWSLEGFRRPRRPRAPRADTPLVSIAVVLALALMVGGLLFALWRILDDAASERHEFRQEVAALRADRARERAAREQSEAAAAARADVDAIREAMLVDALQRAGISVPDLPPLPATPSSSRTSGAVQPQPQSQPGQTSAPGGQPQASGGQSSPAPAAQPGAEPPPQGTPPGTSPQGEQVCVLPRILVVPGVCIVP